MYKRSLVWLRRDLRTHDHRAWSEAEQHSQSLFVVFVFDSTILEALQNPEDRRVTFIWESLREVAEALAAAGSQLLVRYGDPRAEIPYLARELHCDAVFTNNDYEARAVARDAQVRRTLTAEGCKFLTFKDHVIFEPHEIDNQSGTAFKIFTPYSRAWRAKLMEENSRAAPLKLKKLLPTQELHKLSRNLDDVFWSEMKFKKMPLWLPTGMSGAAKLLRSFGQRGLAPYTDARNFPALRGGTSGLSTHLRFGTLSTRAALRLTLENPSAGAHTWQSELIWREFYQMLLVRYPECETGAFKKQYNDIKWPGSRTHFKKWCDGETGFPLIDAAMRLFSRTGWMHNRLRMIVASFLTKDLLCDWRWGEEYFARHLLDYERASNIGGWQWASSVGSDAQPYFRIFNPTLQSERFDPEGTFIRDNLPELAALPNKYLHEPSTASVAELKTWGVALGLTYPKPLVTHSEQKARAIGLFK